MTRRTLQPEESSKLRVANGPVSWGVDFADQIGIPPWATVFDEIAEAGYRWVELGPLGYLPEDINVVAAELARRNLQVTGSFIFESLHSPGALEKTLDVTRRTCRMISGLGGQYLVVIDRINRERMATAGRDADSIRLSEPEFQVLLETLAEVVAIATDAGLRPVLHPHVGSYVEYGDEIDRVVEATQNTPLGLCIDTGHSAYAGLDPVELFLKHHRRIDYLHFKDVDPVVRSRALSSKMGFPAALKEGIFCPLGTGMVDFASLLTALDTHAFSGPSTVEQDRDPRSPQTPLEDAKTSLQFLTALGY